MAAEAQATIEAMEAIKEMPTIHVSKSVDADDGKLRKIKIPNSVKKYQRNRQLARILHPKPAVTLLHELKPGISIESMPPTFGIDAHKAAVVLDGKVVASALGTDWNDAKHNAADEALKLVVKDILENTQIKTIISKHGRTDPIVTDEEEDQDEKLPWASLASFALHRMFSKWRDDGLDIALAETPRNEDVPPPTQNYLLATEVGLPDNAHLMHPVSLLNQMVTGIKPEELQRTGPPNSSVTVGYRINGNLYTGTATSAKSARKIAAMHACTAVYGVQFQ